MKDMNYTCDHKGHNPQNCPNRTSPDSMKTNPAMKKADPDYPKGNLKPGMSNPKMGSDTDYD